jgi:hypothetical protein
LELCRFAQVLEQWTRENNTMQKLRKSICLMMTYKVETYSRIIIYIKN